MARRGRDDPYKGFNFKIAIGTVLAAVAGVAIVRKLMPGVAAKFLDPNDYVKDIPATGRPIEGVGTNVATMPPDPPPPPPPPKKPAKRRRSSAAGRKPVRKSGGSGAKRR